MMKTMKHYIWTMGAALTALVMTACSNEDFAVETPQPELNKDNVVILTATLSPKDATTMRGLTDPGDGTLTSAWVENEELLVGYYNTSDDYDYAKGTVTSVDGSGNATITVPLTNPKDGDSQIVFQYPYSAYNGDVDAYTDQLGTLADVSANYDQCSGSGTLTVSGGTPTLPDGVTMTRANCVWKLTFTDGTNDITSDITKLEINDGMGMPYTITPTGLDAIYVSLYAVSDKTITITAYTATGMYRKVKSGVTLDNGNLYTSSGLALKKVNLGDLFASDGNVYENAAAIPAGTTAIGVVAFLDQAGTYNEITEKNYGGGHGLVLCLKNAASGECWSQSATSVEFTGEEVADVAGLKRTTNVSGYTNTATLLGRPTPTDYPAAYYAANYTALAAPASCTTGWFLATAQQWVKMIEGLGGLADGAPSWDSMFDNTHSAASNWNTALEKAGSGKYDSMTNEYLWYWTSSESYYANAVYLEIDGTHTGADYGFKWTNANKTTAYVRFRVRPVLAF